MKGNHLPRRKKIISETMNSSESRILLAQLFNVPARFPKLSSSFANLARVSTKKKTEMT